MEPQRVCVICGGHGAFYARFETHEYLRCPGCGLVYVDSIESSDQLYRSYDGGYWKALRRKLFMPFRGFSSAKHFDRSMERARRIFDKVLAFAKTSLEKPAYLDIGCNKGFLLSAAISKGWNVYGVELVPELTLPFKREYPKLSGQIFSVEFGAAQEKMENGMFDAISGIDVIEHFEDPRKDMGNIYRLLKPGGIFLVQTPDTDNPLAGQLKEKWGALKPKEHLHLFNPGNLESFAREIGFKGLEMIEAFDQEDGNFAAVMSK